jgi:hypothetical protein
VRVTPLRAGALPAQHPARLPGCAAPLAPGAVPPPAPYPYPTFDIAAGEYQARRLLRWQSGPHEYHGLPEAILSGSQIHACQLLFAAAASQQSWI